MNEYNKQNLNIEGLTIDNFYELVNRTNQDSRSNHTISWIILLATAISLLRNKEIELEMYYTIAHYSWPEKEF